MLKKSFSLLVAVIMITTAMAVLIPAGVSADEAAKQLPANAVYVDQTLTGGTVEFVFGGEKYKADYGVNAFAKVSEAAAAVAADGEIWLAPGTYSEGVTFTKNVTILGPKAGIDPNVRGATVDDDWTLNPERGEGEAVLTTSWHMGVNAGSNQVYEADRITVDGLAVSGAGMFRSNYGKAGKITLTIKNIYVYGYTTKNNGPFYSMSYYPTDFANDYRRYLTLENVRVEGLTDATLVHTTCDTYTFKGIYFDDKCNSKLLQTLTFAGQGTTDPAEVTISDCRFNQKASPVINLDMSANAANKPFNSQLSKRSKVTVTIEDCVFSANAGGQSSEDIAISKNVSTDNVEVIVRNNTYLPRSAGNEQPTDEKLIFKNDELRFFGRTYEKNGATWFNWCASGFEFRFKGSGATAKIRSSAPGGTNNAYIKIYVDGEEEGRSVELAAASQNVVLAENLDPAKEHTVRVVKRTNSRSSSAGLESVWLKDGEKLAPPADPGRLIEFIGDSLTVGYASIADVVGNTAWSTAGEDCTKTYAKTVADAFGADYDVIAVSGRGIVNNYGGSTELLMPVLYLGLDEYNNPGVAHNFKRQPDVIVVNMGTNDASAGVSDKVFTEKFEEFLRSIRKNNPNAEIIVAYGLTNQTYIKSMENTVVKLNEEGDAKFSFLKIQGLKSKFLALGHPLAAGYEASAADLIDLISSKTSLGWGETADTTAEETETEEQTPAPTEPATSPVTTPETTEAAGKKGCGSSVSAAAAILTASAAAFCAKRGKKRHNR